MSTSLFGMAKVIRGYSTISKLLDRGYTLKEISHDFDVNYRELEGFYNICNRLSSGETVFKIDACDNGYVRNMANILT